MSDTKKILVVDDSKIALAVSRRLLEGVGFTVRTIDSPSEFVSELRTFSPDLVIVDVEMPAVSGPKLVEIARTHGLLQGVPVLLQSSLSDPEMRALVASCGAGGFASKSGDGAGFLRKVQELLRISEKLESRSPLASVTANLAPLPELLRTGVKWMDTHHQLLFDAAARLDRSVQQGTGSSGVAEALAFLRRYASFHFSAEERLMQEVEFPESESHGSAHVAFRASLDRMTIRLERDGASDRLADELRQFIGTWLADHVNRYDKLVVQHLERRTQVA